MFPLTERAAMKLPSILHTHRWVYEKVPMSLYLIRQKIMKGTGNEIICIWISELYSIYSLNFLYPG